MCTLTWQRTADGYRLLFSRDESLERMAAEPPTLHDAPVPFLAPIDPVGGGTWIATNARGVTLCILNDYQGTSPEAARRAPQSRGLLVKELASCTDEREVTRRLSEMDLSRFHPFVLVAFGPQHGPVAVHHHAGGLSLRLCPTNPMTSSGERAEEVGRHRQKAFHRLLNQGPRPLGLEELRAFHRGDFTDVGPLSVAMSRPGRGTVSVTEVEVGDDETRLAYFPGHPRQSGLIRPSVELTLLRERGRTRSPTAIAIKENVFSLADLFEEKNPGLRKRIPRLCFKLLERLIGAGKINKALIGLGSVPPDAFPERGLASVGVEARVASLRGVSCGESGRAPIYVANHPLGGIDGLALLAVVRHFHGAVIAPVNDVLLRIPHARRFGVGIDKSRTRKSLVTSMSSVFAAQAPVVIFPAGRTSRKVDGKLQDSSWGRMVVEQALRHGRPVVPVFLSGENSRLFYAVARVRTALGLRANLEMFLLPREVLSPGFRRISLTFGTPLSSPEIRGLGPSDFARAQTLRDLCYSLGPRGGEALT